MRTTLEIDDTLLANAMAITGQTTVEAVVAEALRRVTQAQLERHLGLTVVSA
jgi:Arc/MetJ family transcription regulator